MLAGYLGNYSRYEIELKFLLKRLPDTLPDHCVDIHDLYLVDSSLRLRTETSSTGEIIGRKLTKKDRAPDKGHETNIITSLYLSENDARALGDLNGAALSKKRYIREYPDRREVYDIFQGELTGLILAEIEFDSDDSLSRFDRNRPDWEEVTGNPNYSGGTLAFSTLSKLDLDDKD